MIDTEEEDAGTVTTKQQGQRRQLRSTADVDAPADGRSNSKASAKKREGKDSNDETERTALYHCTATGTRKNKNTPTEGMASGG